MMTSCHLSSWSPAVLVFLLIQSTIASDDVQLGPAMFFKWMFQGLVGQEQAQQTTEPTDLMVIGAGFGRTGTASLVEALRILGLKAYHMKDGVMAVPGHLDLWHDHATSQMEGGDGVGEDIINGMRETGFNATLSLPAATLYKPMLRRYPQAKVILTVRSDGDGHAWAASAMGTVFGLFRHMKRVPFKWMPMTQKVQTMLTWCFQMGIGAPAELNVMDPSATKEEIADSLAQAYHDWIDDVKATVPPDQLLIFPAKDGWKPLCEFLSPVSPIVEQNCATVLASSGKASYPYVNERAQFQKVFSIMNAISLVFEWGPMSLLLLRYLIVSRRGGGARQQKAKTN